MKELPLTPNERLWHTEMKGLSTDAAGNEILVGLTVEESIFLLEYVRVRAERGPGYREYRNAHFAKYTELQNKHDIARLQVLQAESARKRDDPTAH